MTLPYSVGSISTLLVKQKKVEAIHATVVVGQQPEKPKSKKVKKQKNVIDGQLDLFGELA